jgi:hypothetical protein
MKLYETFIELETIWAEAERVLTGDDVVDADGKPLTEDAALIRLEAALQRIEGERDDKAVKIACFIKNLRADAEALKAEKVRLGKRQSAAERTAERVTAYLEQWLPAGLKIKDSRAALSWRRSEFVDVQGTVDDLPVEFIRVKREADVSAIKTALKDGQSLSFARLGERQNLQIK